MKKYLLLILGVAIFISCSTSVNISGAKGASKQNRFKDKYTDQIEPGSQLVKSWYHYSVEATADGDYIYKQYFPTTKQMIEYVTYENEKLTVQNGLYKKWTDKGNLMEAGNYKNKEKEGEWKNYNYRDGSLNYYGPYKNGKKEGVWRTVDSLGMVTQEYTFSGGFENGAYKIFTKKGELKEDGVYLNGEIQSKNEHLPSEKAATEYSVVEVKPTMKSCENEPAAEIKPCSDRTMLTAIYKSVKYPSIAREMGIEGTCIVTFVINKDGSVQDVEMIRSLCEEMTAECIRVVKELPAWNPGTQDNVPVKVQFNLPIKFRLE